MNKSKSKVWLLPLLLSAIWCLLLFALFQRSLHNEQHHVFEMARMQAATLYGQMVDVRAWNAAHGGVYVKESEYGAPNPWLPEEIRQARLADGGKLVLVNPAYMSRQIAESAATSGIRLRITSIAPLRPENMADAWENAALRLGMQGMHEVFSLEKNETEKTDEEGAGFFRYMAPLRTEKSCLHCHVHNQIDDIRGGISVSLPAKPFLKAANDAHNTLIYTYMIMALGGILGIGSLSFAINHSRLLAEEKNRIQSAFLANMSHDMRTPLTGIMGMSALLQGSLSPETHRKACAYLRSASSALLDMVTDITAHAALETGQIVCVRQSFYVKRCLKSCLDLFEPGCAEKGLQLNLRFADEFPEQVLGDEFRLRQALGNLVGNAVKFTSRGSIDIVAEALPADRNEVLLRIEVQDSGPGIDEQEMESIFERFVQGAHARMHTIPGTGLGLSISRELARLMGGTLEARNAPKRQGSIFVLSLRCGLPQDGNDTVCPAQKQDVTNGKKPAAKLRILLAEDNRVSAFFIQETLHSAGHSVKLTSDGGQAMNALSAAKGAADLDMAILDLRMPLLDGFELIRRIRSGKTGACQKLPIISITASNSEAAHKELDGLVLLRQMEKPLDAASLLKAVQDLHEQAQQEREGQEKPGPHRTVPAKSVTVMTDSAAVSAEASAHGTFPASTDSPACKNPGSTIFDQQAALKAVEGKQALLLTLVGVLLEDLPDCLGELQNAIRNADTGNVHRLAHALKNSAAMLHLDDLHDASSRLEIAASQGRDLAPAWQKLQTALPEAHKALAAFLETGQGAAEQESRP